MHVRAVPAAELTPEQLAAWAKVQRENPSLASPYFRPEFTQAVAAVRGGVEVAVQERDGQPVGFLPYQRDRLGRARPVGYPLNDFQGWISREGESANPLALLEACRLRSLKFEHWLASQAEWQAHACNTATSPYVDLSAGFQAYQRAQGAGGSEQLKHFGRKFRKCEREVASLRVETDVSRTEVLQELIRWKIEQCRRTGVASAFSVPWVVRLLENLWQRAGPSLRGQLSALHVGNRLAAVHFGLRSFDVLHWWFPAYATEFGKYSPGMLLLVEMMQRSESEGLNRIDLGKGEQGYKTNLSTGATLVAEGSIDRHWWSGWMWHRWLLAKDRIRGSRWRGPAHRVNRFVSRTRVWLGAND